MSRSKRKPWTKEKHLDTSLYWRPIRRVNNCLVKGLNQITFDDEDGEESIFNFELKSPKLIVNDYTYADRSKRILLPFSRFNFHWNFWYGNSEEDIKKLKRK